ncbi:MAG: 4,5-DOPA dioxygenase extradiol [Candidatus Aenigmatarchaeota archaeon]
MPKMPVLFIGHGSPMNAVEDNIFSNNWKKLAKKIPKPKTILCVSAHWLTEGTAITSMDKPRTIHDFYGFPKNLYTIKYPASGSTAFVNKIKDVVRTVNVEPDSEWGLDHGTWSVLRNMYPKVGIPTVQLSLDYRLSLQKAFDIGKELSLLRNEGVLIIGSGNIVHNLAMADPDADPYNWAIDVDNVVKTNLVKKDYGNLINYLKYPSASIAHPTNDHYMPLLYAAGAAENEKPQFFNNEIIYGSVGMRCVVFGAGKLEM